MVGIKNRILFTLLSLSLLFFFPNVSYAQEMAKSDILTISQGRTVNQDYFAMGETIVVSGTINGDTYLAGNTILIDGVINGDLIAIGETITVTGVINGNIRVAGGEIKVSGEIEKNITSFSGRTIINEDAKVNGSVVSLSGTLEVLSPIGRGMTFAAGSAVIDSDVNGDILAGGEHLTLTDKASIKGNLTYYSDSETKITQSESASIGGSITQNVFVNEPTETKKQGEFVFGIGVFLKLLSLLSAFLIGILLVFFAPNSFIQITQRLSNHPLRSLLVGLLFYLLLPFVIILLCISLIGIPFVIILIPLSLFLLFFAKIFVALLIGKYILTYVKQKTSLGWTFFIGLAVYAAITLIPLIGSFVSLLSVIAGTGALLLYKKDLYKSLRVKKGV